FQRRTAAAGRRRLGGGLLVFGSRFVRWAHVTRRLEAKYLGTGNYSVRAQTETPSRLSMRRYISRSRRASSSFLREMPISFLLPRWRAASNIARRDLISSS